MTSPTDLTLTAYQECADEYFAGSPRSIFEPVANLLDELCAHIPGLEVLELGSGPGVEALYLEQRGMTVHRTDATPAFVQRLREAGHAACVLDARHDDWGGPYDAVLANAVLLHLSRADLHRALRPCHAAVREEGVFAFTVKAGDGEAWSEAKLGVPRWFVYWQEAPLRDALARTDWTVLRMTRVQGRLEPWLHVLCRRKAAEVAPDRRLTQSR